MSYFCDVNILHYTVISPLKGGGGGGVERRGVGNMIQIHENLGMKFHQSFHEEMRIKTWGDSELQYVSVHMQYFNLSSQTRREGPKKPVTQYTALHGDEVLIMLVL